MRLAAGPSAETAEVKSTKKSNLVILDDDAEAGM